MWSTDLWKGGLENYAIPLASPDEILVEKTPETMNGSEDELLARAKLIKKHIPDAKLLCKFLKDSLIQ